MRLLVVDDSRAMRAIMGRFLKQLGVDFIEAGTGKEALRILESEEQITAALVDWNMPEMNGYEFVLAVRSYPDRRFESLPIMMVTTETELERVAAALRAGANEYMMKPFTGEILREKLKILGLELHGQD